MQGVDREPAPGQLVGDLRAASPGAREDEHRVVRTPPQHPDQGLDLVPVGHPHPLLLDVIDGERVPLHRDLRGIGEVGLRDALDRVGHGGREQGDLPPLGRRGEQLADVVDEAHAQHLVGLVEHEQLDRLERQRAAAQVIEQPAGRADHDRGLAQRVHLRRVGRAPVDGRDPDGEALGEGAQGLGDLQRQLPGRRHDQGPRRGAALPDELQQGEPEGGGLARARAGTADDVLALEDHRDGGRLDRRRVLEAEPLDGLNQLRSEAEIGKADRFWLAHVASGNLGGYRSTRPTPNNPMEPNSPWFPLS